MSINKQSFAGSERKIVSGLQQALEITLDDHLPSQIDNENNYKTIFILSQTIDKNNCKSSVF